MAHTLCRAVPPQRTHRPSALARLRTASLPALLWPPCRPPHPAVFTSTWLGSMSIGMGEYIIKRVPLVKHIYSAAKQVRAWLRSPGPGRAGHPSCHNA